MLLDKLDVVKNKQPVPQGRPCHMANGAAALGARSQGILTVQEKYREKIFFWLFDIYFDCEHVDSM